MSNNTKQKPSVPKRIWKWFNNEYGEFYEKPRNYLIGGVVALSLIAGCEKLNDKIIEDSVYQGQVMSFGREGLFWNTYEGSFAIGGEERTFNGRFSLDEEARNGENIKKLSKQLYDAVETRAPVMVHVTRPFFCWPWRSSANYHIDKIEFLKE